MNTPKPEFDSEQSEFQEEWLSAYLDDELSPEQRSIVEQRLATDAAAQNLMADLKRIRQLVQDMPNWSGPGIQVPVDDLPAPGQPAPASELDGQLQGLSDLGGIEESLGAAEVPSLDEDVELSDDIAPLVPTTDRPALPWTETIAKPLVAAGHHRRQFLGHGRNWLRVVVESSANVLDELILFR